jgi:hypothetical protein
MFSASKSADSVSEAIVMTRASGCHGDDFPCSGMGNPNEAIDSYPFSEYRYLSLVLIIIKDDVPVTLAAGVAARVGLESRSESDSGLSESSLENTGHGQGTLPGHRSRRS